MLQLKKITKSYDVSGQAVPALRGINLSFKENEFVSILGPSGCGKTTLLNIIGGLDRYSSGDLLVDGKSTKNFKEYEWDAYRNATIGFVFQNYNLISHLSVLDNVEMALTLSGVGPKERKERATHVLTEVGLQEHLYKRPNQLSGGQMQRVAIARALVNNPKILLADEPTGALDSKTSKQIMELIKKISKDRLVIMVTHNGEIAEKFSDRIIKLLDGLVIEDSVPTEIKQDQRNEKYQSKLTSMSYLTALKTSFKNLMTKKGRTIITSLAGSIGIIGIALVLSLSSGMTKYVNQMQSDTLAGFPLMINEVVPSFEPGNYRNDFREFPDEEFIYSYDRRNNSRIHINNIDAEYLNYLDNLDKNLYNSISYSRDVAINILTRNDDGGYLKVNQGNRFSEIPNSPDFIKTQYDILSGTYPDEFDELALVVDKRNRLDVSFLNDFGIDINEKYNFNDLIGKVLKVITNNDYYIKQDNQFIENSDYDLMYNSSNSLSIKIVGILRVKPEATSEILSTGIGYTTMLTDKVLELAETSKIVEAQKNSPDVNVLTGASFNALNTYQKVMRQIGGDTTPVGIQIYPLSFETKDKIKLFLDDYNKNKTEEDKIIYTDLAETISSAIATLINSITIILSAFAGISLVVSSIMIGIITFVSVVERTKEIGIMRSLGARKKDISRIFNAETVIIGFVAGIFGILIAIILNIPINFIIERYIDVPGFAYLPILSAVSLILLSTSLTLIAGLIPSRIAAKKDPVIALRTE